MASFPVGARENTLSPTPCQSSPSFDGKECARQSIKRQHHVFILGHFTTDSTLQSFAHETEMKLAQIGIKPIIIDVSLIGSSREPAYAKMMDLMNVFQLIDFTDGHSLLSSTSSMSSSSSSISEHQWPKMLWKRDSDRASAVAVYGEGLGVVLQMRSQILRTFELSTPTTTTELDWYMTYCPIVVFGYNHCRYYQQLMRHLQDHQVHDVITVPMANANSDMKQYVADRAKRSRFTSPIIFMRNQPHLIDGNQGANLWIGDATETMSRLKQ